MIEQWARVRTQDRKVWTHTLREIGICERCNRNPGLGDKAAGAPPFCGAGTADTEPIAPAGPRREKRGNKAEDDGYSKSRGA